MVYIPKGKERRTENRCAFLGEIPGRLLHQSQELEFIAVDVSRKGLGVLLTPCPAEGEEILVEFANPDRASLRFTVKHIYEGAAFSPEFDDEGHKAMKLKATTRRCGIELAQGQQENTDLIELFTSYMAAIRD